MSALGLSQEVRRQCHGRSACVAAGSAAYVQGASTCPDGYNTGKVTERLFSSFHVFGDWVVCWFCLQCIACPCSGA
jgi:hypothetical protein